MILITAPVHDSFLQVLQQRNIPFQYLPDIQKEQLFALIPEATGLVVSTQISVDAVLLDLATSLQWIGRLGSGMEHIDVAYATEKGIRCVSSPEGNSNAVAELALGSLLNLFRNISKSSLEVKQLQWKREENRGVEISGKTIGIIGFGNTGSRLAHLLTAFGCRILVYDKYKKNIGTKDMDESSLEDIFLYADVLSLHLPLNMETRHLVNAEFFASLKKQPILINTSRGGIVHTVDLIDALETGKLKGAVLDVLENEKMASLSPEEKNRLAYLNQHPSVIITPHIAGYTNESFIRLGLVLLEKLGLA